MSATDPSGHYDITVLPPIDIGAPSWSTFNWASFVASGAGSQAYLAAVYGRIIGASYYGSSILPFAIGNQLQYRQYLSFLRVYGPQLQAAGYFRTRPANLTPPAEPAAPVAAGFARGSYAYAYITGCGLPCARTVGSVFGGISGGVVGAFGGAAVGGAEGFGLSAPTGPGVLVGTPAGALAGAFAGAYAGAKSGAAAGAALGEGLYTWYSENQGGAKSGVPDSSFEPSSNVSRPYTRPSGAGPTAAQRAAVQGQPCVDCGQITSNQVADHIDPLIVQYYRQGAIDIQGQTSISAVEPHCPTCSAIQGGQLSAFSRAMKLRFGFPEMIDLEEAQKQICSQFSAPYYGCDLALKVGVSRNLK